MKQKPNLIDISEINREIDINIFKNTSNRVTVTGYQQSSKNKTSKGQQGQKDLDKYFVPRNMSIDDYDKLNINTQAYIQRNNLDWTYDQALRWQKR